MWDKYTVLNQDGQVTIAPCLFSKAIEWCQINERVTWSYYDSLARHRKKFSFRIQTSISGRKQLLTIIIEIEREMTRLLSIYRYFVLEMLKLKINDENITLWILGQEWLSGTAFFCTTWYIVKNLSLLLFCLEIESFCHIPSILQNFQPFWADNQS